MATFRVTRGTRAAPITGFSTRTGSSSSRNAGDVLSDPGEISVATDKPTLVFRDWYRSLVGK